MSTGFSLSDSYGMLLYVHVQANNAKNTDAVPTMLFPLLSGTLSFQMRCPSYLRNATPDVNGKHL